MSIVETFTKDTLLKRIEGLNTPVPVALNSDTVTMGNPTVVTGAHNTQLKLTGSSLYTEGHEDILVGTVNVAYDRLDLAKLFKGVRLYFKLSDDKPVASLYAFLPTLSNLVGVALYEEDVNDVAITPATEKVTVVAKSTSLNVTGKVDITFFVPPIDLDKLNGNLDIFKDDVSVSDLVYNTIGGSTLFPVNAYRLTKDVDFSRYRNELASIGRTGMNDSTNRVSVGRILRMEFGLTVGDAINPDYRVTSVVNGNTTVVTLKTLTSTDKFEFKYTDGSA